MQTSSFLVYAIGFVAQAFFSARMLIQWIMSERAHRSVSPNMYWICSLAGSVLLFLYGWARHDFAIILGQLISYYIYIWNLNLKGIWQRLSPWLRYPVLLLPVLAVCMLLSDAHQFVLRFFFNPHVSLWLLIWGSAGQIIFTLRFIYQWKYSLRLGESVLPVGFWIISLIGSCIIVSYGAFRMDPVLILGQSVGFFTYSRNIMLYQKAKR